MSKSNHLNKYNIIRDQRENLTTNISPRSPVHSQGIYFMKKILLIEANVKCMNVNVSSLALHDTAELL